MTLEKITPPAHIGIDLGGTKTEILALNSRGETLYSRRVASPKGDYGDTVKMLYDLIHSCETDLGLEASIGIGTPGAISTPTQLMKNSNSTWLNGKPLLHDLQNALARPVAMANDANCFALSEATDGAAAGLNCVFGVIIGTGTGGGIVVNGQVLKGPNSIAGEWGHNPIPWPRAEEQPGPACYCGKQACIETFLSGPGMQRDYLEQSGENLPAQEIVALANEGKAEALACLERYYDRIARALAHVINILDPDAIVLGGGMSNIESLYQEIPVRLGKYVFTDEVVTPVLRAKYGDASGVRGAAWLGKKR